MTLNDILLSDSVATQIQTILMKANKDIFLDLGWQFTAYRLSGLCALEYVFEKEGSGAVNISAWRLIDEGVENNDDLKIQQGNRDLLKREQSIIVVPSWVALKNIDLVGNLVSWLFSILAENPVPGGASFETIVPGGDITDFDDRWEWISKPSTGMWDIFINAPSATRKGWITIPIRTRADDYNLVPQPFIW